MSKKKEAKAPQHTNKDVQEFVKSSRKFGVKTKPEVFLELFMGAK